MSRFTELPVAVAANDAYIFCIVDPTPATSYQITLANLRQQLTEVGSLYGSANQGIALNATPQYLTGFANQGSNSNAILGELTVPEDGLYEIKTSVLADSNAYIPMLNSQAQLFVRVDATTTHMTDTESLANFNQNQYVTHGSVTISLLAGQKLTMGLAMVNTGFTVDINDTQFTMRKI